MNELMSRRWALLVLSNVAGTYVLRFLRSPDHPFPLQWMLDSAEFLLSLPLAHHATIGPLRTLLWVTCNSLFWSLLIEGTLRRFIDRPKDSDALKAAPKLDDADAKANRLSLSCVAEG